MAVLGIQVATERCWHGLVPHPTTTHCPSRVVRSPPASAPLRARLGNRYGGWAASLPRSPAGGGGVWVSSRLSRRSSERDSVATSPPGSRTAATRSRAALRIPEGVGARDSPEAACGGIGAFLTRDDPVRPVRGAGTRAPGRSRRPRRRRGSRPQGSGRGRSHARVRVRRSVSAPHLGHPLTAPARPSSAPRGGARVPAPLPGLRQRAPTRHRPRQIRQQPPCASPSPRPRRTTWRGTPSPA